jgi:hypothetical protein
MHGATDVQGHPQVSILDQGFKISKAAVAVAVERRTPPRPT